MSEAREQALWLLLAGTPGVGEARLLALMKEFGDPSAVLRASPQRLRRTTGLDEKAVQSLMSARQDDSGSVQLESLHRIGGRLVLYGRGGYPQPLTEIYSPPPFLFVLGAWSPDDHRAIAIVGSRRASSYGRRVARSLARELADRGFTIISGMARGVDSEAHRGALEAGGRTIAVLGSGLDVPYPPENRGLMSQIARNGAVLTEFTLGTEPLAGNFPQRNRLISGLARGVVVVEAADRSGAMITAGYALDQGREVYAVPGSIETRTSRGTNLLIKRGAKLVQSVEDILEELPQSLVTTAVSPPTLSPVERSIWDILAEEPLHVDVMARHLGLSSAALLSTLLGMELRGLIRQQPGKVFERA